ncbi:hypothetical protein [Winogradskyella sp.]|uniref:hypothetical protein n=1 Tax=Winogradskyella sp. TaxID=1883156 RepID=UPI0035C81FA4
MNNLVKIDFLNTFLIVLSLVIACILPFELFIIAYAILGPLHYITEINWIREKGYFLNNSYWIYIIISFSAVIALPLISKLDFFANIENDTIFFIQNQLPKYTNTLIFLALVIAYAFLFIKSKTHIIGVIFAGFITAILLNDVSTYNLFIGIFLPTIIHVYLFTLLFMWYGNIKARTSMGTVNIVLLATIPFIISFLNLDMFTYNFSDEIKNIITDNRFHVLNVNLSKLLGLSDGTKFFFYEIIDIKIQIFIAFAYTYHYLNWFSKTTVIGWHKKLTQKKSLLMLILWAISISIYLYDYKVGLAVLLILSLSHVFAEFPLNMISIKGIFMSIFNRKQY